MFEAFESVDLYARINGTVEKDWTVERPAIAVKAAKSWIEIAGGLAP